MVLVRALSRQEERGAGTCLAGLLGVGWVAEGWLSHPGEAENPVAAPSMTLDTSEVPSWRRSLAIPAELLVFLWLVLET